jgi:hypothetical protein
MKKLCIILFSIFLLTSCQLDESDNGQERGQQAHSNVFDPHLVKVGDNINGLEIQSIALDTFDTGSIFIDFVGEIELTGTFKYYTFEEITNQDYAIYFTLDEQSVKKLPRIKQKNMNYTVTIGIENHVDAEKVLGPPGTEGKATILFSHYKIRKSLSKPIDDSLYLVRLLK